MSSGAVAELWMGYAATGRPDFLNYLRRGDVTWPRLWEYYRAAPADPGAMLRLVGLFHIFHSQDFDGEGCSLDPGSAVGAALREWAEFAVECADFLPEAKVRENLAGLLGQSLVSPLYYEAVFNIYLHVLLCHLASGAGTSPLPPAPETIPAAKPRRLRVLLDGGRDEPVDPARWPALRDKVVERAHAAWEREFILALGEDEEDWLDEGGEG